MLMHTVGIVILDQDHALKLSKLTLRSLKYVRKLCALNFQIVAVSRPRIGFFPLRCRVEALTKQSLILKIS